MTVTPPTVNDRGDEEHPSFGLVQLSRISATPGVSLFDSSITHNQFVRLSVKRATRHRDLHKDWIYPVSGPDLIEVNMTLTQWGALVSSFGNGTGTPVTLHRVAGEVMPEAPHASRLAETAREVADAARKSTERISAAAAAVLAAFEVKAGRREMATVLAALQSAVGGVPANMKFAADTLTRHAEDVVTKARADIEAAQQFTPQPSLPTPPPAPKELP